jgi:hypothetical protein
MNPEESGVSKEANETPFIAGNFSISEKYRLAALSLAFFAPQHDPRQWLTGWYPKTLGNWCECSFPGRGGVASIQRTKRTSIQPND